MESTIRFTDAVNGEYQCKQVNFIHVPTGSKTNIEADTHATSGVSLVVRDKAMVTLDTPKVEEDFTLTLHNISIVSASGAAGNKATCFMQFGYPHNYNAVIFTFDPVTNPGEDLVLERVGKNLTVIYAGSTVKTESNIVGPLLSMHIKNNVDGKDFEVFVSDIVYES